MPFSHSFISRADVVARRGSKVAFGAWLVASLAMVASSTPAAGLAAWLGPGLLSRLQAATVVLMVVAGVALFRRLFGEKFLGKTTRATLRLAAPAGAFFLTLAAGATQGVPVPAAAIAAVPGIAALAVGSLQVLRAADSREIRWFLAGLVALAPSLALALASAAGVTNAVLSLVLVGAAALSAAAWGAAVSIAASAARAELDAAQDKIIESARKYRHVYYSVPIALVSVDTQGNVLRWNEMAQEAFGHMLEQGRLNPLARVLGDEATAALLAAVRDHGRHRSELRVESDGEVRTYAVDALAVGSDIELSFGDVSERSRLAATLEHIAHHDFLTHCLNRRGLEREIDKLLGALTERDRAAFLYVDLDRFKTINDVFGHAAGDAIVLEVARRLTAQLPAPATVGRIGGDEFMAVLPGFDLAAAKAQAQRVFASLTRETVDYEGMQLNVEASIGVIEATPGMQTRELLAYADEACAQSKRAGRGRITALDAANEALVNYRAEKLYGTQLRFRLPTERMRLYAQPIVPLKGASNVLSYEVLLRTEDEHGRIEPPSRLLAAAERQGAMPAIDRFMLTRTVAHLAEHPGHSMALGFVCVNLSGMSLNDERFVADAIALLREHRAIAARLCLEITESVALYDISSTRRFVDEMHAIGASIALDDFGAGYTSFAYLKDLPASLLKIDGQFINGLARGEKHQGIVRAIQQVGRELGMKCLAEWVEDKATLQALIELDVDYAQGYVFSRARPIEHWLDAGVDLAPLLTCQA